MVKQIKKNITLIIIITIVIIVLVATFIKVYTNHKNHLYEVVEKRITESAKRCFNEDVCTGNQTTLGFLIEHEYIDEQIEPVTKEYIDKNLIITYKNGICKTKIR